MSKIPNNDDELNDADLAKLFASNNSEPPKDLDKLILDNALLSQHESLPKQHETFTQKYAPIFGTAAVLMIAIGLTPMTMNAPQSTPHLTQGPAPTPEPMPQTPNTAETISAASSTAQTTAAVSVVKETTDTETSAIASEMAIDTTETQITAAVPEVADRTSGTESADSASNASIATNSSAEVESIELISTADEPIEQVLSEESNTAEAESMTETDSDALGIDTDENIARESVQIDEKQVARLKTATPLVNKSTPADSKNTTTTEPSTELLPNVAKIDSSPNRQVNDDAELEPEKTALSSAAKRILEERSSDQAVELMIVAEPPNDTIELQDNEAMQNVEQTPSTAASEIQAIDEPVRLKRAPEQDLSLRAEQEVSQPDKPAPEKVKKTRSSAFLWVIEIKRLYKENMVDEAKEELTLFRKKFPDNDNERLLPKELLDTISD